MKFKEWLKIQEYDDGYERLRPSRGLRMPPENLATFFQDRGHDTLADISNRITPQIGGFMSKMLSQDKVPMGTSYTSPRSSRMDQEHNEFYLTTDKQDATHLATDAQRKKVKDEQKAWVIQQALASKEVKALIANRKINPQFAHADAKTLASDPTKEIWRVRFDAHDPNDKSLGYYTREETPQEPEHGK